MAFTFDRYSRALALLTVAGCAFLACESDEGSNPSYGFIRDAASNGGSAGTGSLDGSVSFDGSIGNRDGSNPASDASVRDGAAGDAAVTTTDGGSSNSVDAAQCLTGVSCNPVGTNTCGPDKACRVIQSTIACESIAGVPIVAGQNCQFSEQCAHGLVCINLGKGATCTKLCPAGSKGFCGASAACSIEITGQPCINMCVALAVPCNIYDVSICGVGQKCGLARNPETAERYTGCTAAGQFKVGDPCSADTQCLAGTVCVSVNGVSRCQQVCGPNNTNPVCLFGGQTCTGKTSQYDVSYCK
jgi:hypothetical protein